jgi:hypothetical protein
MSTPEMTGAGPSHQLGTSPNVKLVESQLTNSKAEDRKRQESSSEINGELSPQEYADEFILDEIYRDLCLIGSYTNSALEACRRGDRDELRLRLRLQLPDHFRHAVKLHKLLSAPDQASQEARQ